MLSSGVSRCDGSVSDTGRALCAPEIDGGGRLLMCPDGDTAGGVPVRYSPVCPCAPGATRFSAASTSSIEPSRWSGSLVRQA